MLRIAPEIKMRIMVCNKRISTYVPAGYTLFTDHNMISVCSLKSDSNFYKLVTVMQ